MNPKVVTVGLERAPVKTRALHDALQLLDVDVTDWSQLLRQPVADDPGKYVVVVVTAFGVLANVAGCPFVPRDLDTVQWYITRRWPSARIVAGLKRLDLGDIFDRSTYPVESAVVPLDFFSFFHAAKLEPMDARRQLVAEWLAEFGFERYGAACSQLAKRDFWEDFPHRSSAQLEVLERLFGKQDATKKGDAHLRRLPTNGDIVSAKQAFWKDVCARLSGQLSGTVAKRPTRAESFPP